MKNRKPLHQMVRDAKRTAERCRRWERFCDAIFMTAIAVLIFGAILAIPFGLIQ